MTQPDDFITATESTKEQLAAALTTSFRFSDALDISVPSPGSPDVRFSRLLNPSLPSVDPPSVDPPSVDTVSWRTVASTLGVLVLVVLVAPFVVHAFPMLIGAEHSYVVTSGSMEPSIGLGSVIMVNEVDPSQIERGDVITYTRGENAQPTTHRVIEVVDNEGSVAFRTKGDANEDPDLQLVSPGEVEGRVMTIGGHMVVFPLIGYVITFANTQTGYMAMVIVPIALLVVNEIYNVLFDRDSSGSSTMSADPLGPAPASGSGVTDEEPEWLEHGTSSTAQADSPARTEPTGGATDVEAESDATYTFTPTELRLGALILAAFSAYSLWVATTETTVWSTGVAAAAIVAFILVVGLYVTGGSSPDESDAETSLDDGLPPSGGQAATRTPADEVPTSPPESQPASRDAPVTDGTDQPPAGVGTPSPASPGPAMDAGKKSSHPSNAEAWPPDPENDDVVVRPAKPDEAVLEMPRQHVGSFVTLVDMAAATGRPIYQDWESETHYLEGKQFLYVHDHTPTDAEGASERPDVIWNRQGANDDKDDIDRVATPDQSTDVIDEPVADDHASNGTSAGEESDD